MVSTTVDESDTATHTYVFSIFDPGVDTITGTGTSCGVGAIQVGPTTNTNTSLTFTCKFLNGPSDPSLQANATDSDGATGPFTFQAVHVNNVAPVAVNDTGSTNEDTNVTVAAPGVLGNDTDVVADSLSVAQVNGSAANVGVELTLASGAKVTLNANGSYTYKPSGAFEGLDTGETATDSFTYRASDGTDLSNSATVSITINGVNDAPTAHAQSVSTDEDTSVLITLRGSDIDGDSQTFAIVSGPSHGSLGPIGTVSCTLAANPRSCAADVTYTPALNYNGPDSFTFKVNDGTVDSAPATVTITVNAVNDAPVNSVPGAQTTDEDTPWSSRRPTATRSASATSTWSARTHPGDPRRHPRDAQPQHDDGPGVHHRRRHGRRDDDVHRHDRQHQHRAQRPDLRRRPSTSTAPPA